MGKYIIELKQGEMAYKTVDSKGTPMIQLLEPIPYTEPDTESIRKRGYDKGLDDIGNALRLLLFQYSNYTLQTIFGYDTARAVVEHFEGSEIVARIRCYEGGVKQDVETIRNEAYQRGYETAKHECEDCPKQAYTDTLRMDVYQKGLSDAWDAARKIVLPGDVSGIYLADLEEIFDRSSLQDVIKDYSASECIEKIRQYEQEKEEIKVGDEVINRDKKAVVTEITDRFVRIMYSDGSGYALFSENMTKTGRTFPEISEVLQKMKETNNG